MPAFVYKFNLLVWISLLSTSALAAWNPVITQGDVVVAAGPSARAIATAEPTQLWPAGVIPYTIDPSLPAQSIEAIRAAIVQWNAVPGISLRPLDDAEALAGFSTRDTVEFVPGELCASWIGRRGGSQSLWVSPTCHSGSVMHEIGHLIGLEHEHTRPDRDQYIQIHWENIDADKQHNFDAAPAGTQLIGEYDYDSIMHYGTSNFSSNGLNTISVLDSAGSGRSSSGIGQRSRLSVGDSQAVNTLYAADLSLVTRLDNDLGVLDVFVTNESLQGAHEVTVELDIGLLSGDWTRQDGNENWVCSNETALSLSCTLNRLPGGAVEKLSLPVGAIADVDVINVLLKANTPDNDTSNNSEFVLPDAANNPSVILEPDLRSAEDLATVVDSELPLQNDGSNRVSVGGTSFWLLGGLLLLCVRVLSRRYF